MSWTHRVPSEPTERLPESVKGPEERVNVQENFSWFGPLVEANDPRVLAHPVRDVHSPELAREIFLAFDGLAAGSVGGHRVYANVDREALERIQIAMHAIVRATAQVRSVSARTAVDWIHLPSSWHAAIWLTLRQLEARPQGDHLAFRGQADPCWDLATSWHRVREADRGRTLVRRTRFERLLAKVAVTLGFPVNTQICRAASQHHGLTSKLLDFTSDPLVAIWFAIDMWGSGEQPQRAIWYQRTPALRRLGGRFIVAPPFLRRVHAQRGFFVERRHPHPLPTSGFRLATFDWRREAESDFAPVWLGRQVPLHPTVRWLEDLARHVRAHDAPLSRSAVRRSLLAHVKTVALREAELSLGVKGLSEDTTVETYEGPWTDDTHSNIAYDTLYRIAIVYDGRGGLANIPLMRHVVRHNRLLMQQLINAIKQPQPTLAGDEADLKLAAVIERLLSN